MRSKFGYYILLSTIYLSVPVGFIIFKINFFFFEFSPISLITLFSKECFRSLHVSFLFAGILDTTIQFRWNTDVIGRARQTVYQATLTACHWYSRAYTLFSKVPTFFPNVVTFDCNDFTIAFNSVTSLVVSGLLFLGVSG